MQRIAQFHFQGARNTFIFGMATVSTSNRLGRLLPPVAYPPTILRSKSRVFRQDWPEHFNIMQTTLH
jgi:hypothetical protein